ncbi:hypothetical protein Salmi_Mp134 (mitochondrion) [Salvia miltiorrhiza]|uniref:Uncharacterized protein n=1 Tax=Salvia miltiorrhiza TaxID=226208 RepID=V9P522_SALMI|nr:hypothetical protein Salmi_Mp134 [Salvia miltiorrhiza]AGU16661.1 hypothetical protein Salmi_Mp134 [Salvia miltiorrhiza]
MESDYHPDNFSFLVEWNIETKVPKSTEVYPNRSELNELPLYELRVKGKESEIGNITSSRKTNRRKRPRARASQKSPNETKEERTSNNKERHEGSPSTSQKNNKQQANLLSFLL